MEEGREMGDPWQKDALGWVPLVEVGVGQKETLQRTRMFKGPGGGKSASTGWCREGRQVDVCAVLEAGLGGNVVAPASCSECLELRADLPQ